MAPVDTLLEEGRVWFRRALSDAEAEALDLVVPLDVGRGRRLQATPDVMRAIAPADALARSLLAGARPVRLTAFDKTREANWALPWHQDRVIAVRERFRVDGFSNWTRKDGVWHVEPPEALLRRMFFLRVCVDDDMGLSGGGLMIAPGTHRDVVSADFAEEEALAHGEEHCDAERGDVLACMALLLHRSQGVKQDTPRHRRALRIDYSADELPAPLEWDMAG